MTVAAVSWRTIKLVAVVGWGICLSALIGALVVLWWQGRRNT